MQWPTLDPALPALPLALDAAAVSRRFREEWPTTAGAAPLVTECRRQEIQYRPARHCLVTYKLAVEPVGVAPYQTIVAVEATLTGVSQRSFMADPHLGGLATAGTTATMQDRLIALSQTDGVDGASRLAITPLRYKAGVRCALRYDLQTGAAETSYFGKLIAGESAHLAQTITLLATASQAEPALPHIAPLLAHWSDLDMVVQAAMTGAELHSVAFDDRLAMDERLAWFAAAGRTIAALHSLAIPANCPGVGAPQWLADDVAGLSAYSAAIGQVNPALAERFGEAVAFLADSTAPYAEAAPVITHGALRTDQFLLDGAHLVLIDLDSVCWASPARDLGNFLAYLTWKALRQPHHASLIQQAQQAFLAGYQMHRSLPEAAWLTFYQVASLLKIIGRRYTGLTVQEWPLTATLLTQTLAMLMKAKN